MIIQSIFQNVDILLVGSAITISVILGFIVYFSDPKSATSKSFLTFSLIISAWNIINYLSYQTTDAVSALILTRLVMFSAIWQTYSFYQLMKIFPGQTYQESKLREYLTFLVAFFVSIFTLTPYVFKSVIFIENSLIPHPQASWGIAVFGLTAMTFIFLGIYNLVTRYFKKKENRSQVMSLICGVFITFFFIILFNFIFPVYLNDSSYIPYSAIFTFPFFIFTSFSIIRYKLLNIRILSTELVVFLVIITSLFETLLSKSLEEKIFRGLIFFVLMTFGVILIKNVMKEVQQREKIQKLAIDLSKTNDKLKSANDKLKELSRQKTEFVSIASHQLRSPLTAIKGYSSMLLEGSFGELADKPQVAVDVIFQSSQKLITIIEDFLNITRLELGRMKYEMSIFDLGELTETVINNQKPNIAKKGLTLEFQKSPEGHQILADNGKITQVVSNLVDNAIKYTPAGWIKIKIENVADTTKKKTGKIVRLSIADSGVGIEKATMSKLFAKFVRADDAGRTNITGTGLGLYVAKQIVESLKGKIWAESSGKGKGSTFFVEFPQAKGGVTQTEHKIEAYTKKDLPKSTKK